MILVLGDSFTAGSGLSDYDPNNPPSSLCWASLVEQKTGTSVDNHAKAGLSNAEIFDRFLTTYDPGKHTAVIILWSYLTRIYFPDPYNPDQLITGRPAKPTNGHGSLNKILEFYYRYFYSDKVAAFELAGFQQLVHCKAQCPVFHDCIDKTYINYADIATGINSIEQGNSCSFTSLWEKLGKKVGSQGHHYSEQTHQVWAEDYVVPRLQQVIGLAPNHKY